jgi:ABC-type glycerol-3-phosphate transport system substrate-binding protein
VTAIPWDAAQQKIAGAIAAKQTPDVSMIGTTLQGEVAKTGALDPTPADLVDKNAFFPGAWDGTVVDGTAYGVPWYVETRVIYYRTDLAQKAGITAPPKTWDELTAMAKAKPDGEQWLALAAEDHLDEAEPARTVTAGADGVVSVEIDLPMPGIAYLALGGEARPETPPATYPRASST